MRKQSQLADLIAGSGLVNGLARRASSQDGNSAPTQPVLYHFGGKAGSTSNKDPRERPLPASSAANSRPSTSLAWPSSQVPSITLATAISTDIAFASLPSGTTHRGPSPSPDSSLTEPSAAAAQLPHLASLRAGTPSDAALTEAAAFPPAGGFLPAVGGGAGSASPDQHPVPWSEQPPLPHPNGAIPAGAMLLEPGTLSGAGSGSGGAHMGASTGGANSLSGQGAGGPPHAPFASEHGVYHNNHHQSSQSGPPGHVYGSGSFEHSGGSGAVSWHEQVQQPTSHRTASPEHGGGGGGRGGSYNSGSGGGGGQRNVSSTSGASPVRASGARGGKAYGGGGGGFTNKRWAGGRPSSTSTPSRASVVHRSASDCAMHFSTGDVAGVATAMSVTGAWTAAAESVIAASTGTATAGPMGLAGSASESGTSGGGSGARSLADGGSGGLRFSREPRNLSSGISSSGLQSSELLVVAEESSEGDGGVGATPRHRPPPPPTAVGVVSGGAGTMGAAAGAGHQEQEPSSESRWSLTQLTPAAVTSLGGGGGTAAGRPATAQEAGGGGSGGGGMQHSVIAAGGSGAISQLPAGALASGGVAWAGSGGVAAESELAELRRMVVELTGQVTRLTSQLRDSELATAQLQSLAQAAVAAEREAADLEAARRHMKALKGAEAARDKSETARRGAEKRARAAEEELAVLKEKLEAKTKQAADLEAAAAVAAAHLERQRKAHEEAVAVLEGQHEAQMRKHMTDAEERRRALQENMSKMQETLAKRNQTILSLQADLETATAAAEGREKQLEEMKAAVVKMQAERDRQHESERMKAEAERARVMELRAEESSLPSGGQTTRSRVEHIDGTSGNAVGTPRLGSAATSNSATASPTLASRRSGLSYVAPQSRSGSMAPVGSGVTAAAAAAAALMDEQTRAVRKLQTEVAAIREEYARRLVDMEDVVASCEAGMKDGVQGLERMFGVLVSRTAAILAGRLGYFKPPPSGTKTPGRPTTPTASNSARNVSASAGASTAGGGGGGGATTAVHNMNERLATENAQLLAELTRWQSGRHAMLRKLNMVVLGTDPPPLPATPLTHQQKIAQALAAVTGPNHHHSAAGGTPSGTSGQQGQAQSQSHNRATFSYQQSFSAPNSAAAAAAADALAAGGPMTPAREALAAATRETLLAGRKEVLPPVMTAEGWGGGAAGSGAWDAAAAAAQLHGGKAEATLVAAESSLRLRSQVLALQAEVTRARAAGGEVVERGRETAVMQESHELALSELRRNLATAKQTISHMQRELERARAGIPADGGRGGGGGGLDVTERARLEDALSNAKEETARHKAAAAAARRESEVREKQLAEAQLKLERSEAQLRDSRNEAARQTEGVKRLRLLLAQAKALLKEQGVPFMEEDPGLDLLVAGGASGGAAGAGGKQAGGGRSGPQRAASASVAQDADGPLFKALDAREREKEMQRNAAEIAELKSQLATAQKELKKAKKATAAAAEAAAAEAREQRQALAGSIEASAAEAAAARESSRALQRQLQEAQHEVGDLRRQLGELGEQLTRARLDGDYLRARAAVGRMKPKLTHARALSISISAGAATAPAEGGG